VKKWDMSETFHAIALRFEMFLRRIEIQAKFFELQRNVFEAFRDFMVRRKCLPRFCETWRDIAKPGIQTGILIFRTSWR
jgi:hypothetical protein